MLVAAVIGTQVTVARAPAVDAPTVNAPTAQALHVNDNSALVSGGSDSDLLSSLASLAPAPAPPTPASVTATTAPEPPAAASLSIGYRVRIARLGIDLPIAEGDIQRDTIDQRTPEGYAFHLPGTSLPGEAGNTYLYAHARVGMFLSLWNARAGDVVVVTAPGGITLVYVVREVRRVAPADVSVAGSTADERLTLQTSTGPSPQDPRFVVIAFPRS